MARKYPQNPINYAAYKLIHLRLKDFQIPYREKPDLKESNHHQTSEADFSRRTCVTCQYLVQSLKKVSQYAKEKSLTQDASTVACSLTNKDEHACDQYMPGIVNLVHDYLESYDPSDACQ
ncbi:hypothetical protein T265_12655, partial [Opisthorchis viverrini]